MTPPTVVASDEEILRLAAAALSEPTCTRPDCECTGALTVLHVKVDRYRADSLAESIERTRDCELLGHLRPTGYVPDAWMRRTVRCTHCQAVLT